MELLAPDKDVNGTKGRLKRQFPDRSIAVDAGYVQDPLFLRELLAVLAKLDQNYDLSKRKEGDSEQFLYVSSRDDGSIDGIIKQPIEADTPDPRLVTEMLIGVLRGLGRGSDTQLPRILKRSREEILSDGTHRPWRRSALWLLIRVSLQLTLTRLREPTKYQPQYLYKDFMLFTMSYILNLHTLVRDDASIIPHDVLQVMMAKIARRAIKYGRPQEQPWFAYTERIMKQTSSLIQDNWSKVQAAEATPLDFTSLEKLDFERDSQVQLWNLQPYLDQRRLMPAIMDASKLEEHYGPEFQRNSRDYLPTCNFTGGDLSYFQLADFEDSIDMLGQYRLG